MTLAPVAVSCPLSEVRRKWGVPGITVLSSVYFSVYNEELLCYIQTGSISLAHTQDRLISLRRLVSRLQVMGIPCDIISPKQVAQLHPLVNIHDLVGAMHVPGDAVISPPDVVQALVTAAVHNGVQIFEGASVNHVMVEKGHVTGIETDRGHIECEYFVNCAGQWAYELGLMSEEPVTVPLHPCEHFYLVTRPLKQGLRPDTPVIMDLDGRIYVRNWQGGVLSGGFEKNPKPIFTEGRNQLEFQSMLEDWDHYEPLLSALLRRMPSLESTEILQLVNCPESFTADMRCIMGESAAVQNYFVLAGMNSNLLELDQSKTFYKPDWFDIVGAEVKCCKEAVCVIDMSSFTKFELSSSGGQALEILQHLCSNDLDVPVGHIVHTGMLNERGGYQNDCSVVRLNKRSFFIISPTDQQVHCWSWLKQHMPKDSQLQLEDVTWKYTALNLIGPRAMDVLSELSYVPMTSDHFPSLFCKEMSVGYANGIRVMSMTHTGEPGFMLYIPIEYALHVYNEIMNVGQKYGIRNAGYYALRSLRIEKFFAFWGQDLDTFSTPLECGREFRVKFDKGTDFIGREALLQQRQEGVCRRFTMFILDDHDTDLDLWPWWGEPIYRNGHYVGMTTSSAYSFTLARHVCLGFVHQYNENTGNKLVVTPDFINRGDYEIEIAGQRFKAKAKLYPFSSLFTQKKRKDEMELSSFQGK
ncbi:hypothetical protein scyTo_0003628 [Scyliorhinus torazame]|uniref:Pyruvate dehydrogenase phosphatase regulatory subunit, mitochondrial n=1 Tax=Scyliorhinus torazame TaxID=75743 RepID=A0A401PN31_SCYTO|nr:hypothetical protein [Scyliorhinus torazame]